MWLHWKRACSAHAKPWRHQQSTNTSYDARTCNPSTQEAEIGRSQLQSRTCQYSAFEVKVGWTT